MDAVPTENTSPTVLTPTECFEFLAGARVGRIGVSIDALPAILPVHFTVLDRSVLFPTVPGSKLDSATQGTVVAFQADDLLTSGSRRWSVLLQGMATGVDDPWELAEVATVPNATWTTSPDTAHWVRIRPGTMSGNLFG